MNLKIRDNSVDILLPIGSLLIILAHVIFQGL